ncbi:MAG: DNA double-strand break repair nuclease NurA [Desulfurococcaceae archaeon]
MKYIALIIDELRKRVTEGLRVTREDSSIKPVELIDEASSKQIEVLDEPVVKQVEVKPAGVRGEIFALDSSSRVIETPYVFIGVGAGSVYSRLTGRSIDAPHASSILGLEEPLCKHMVVIPEVELEQDYLNNVKLIPGVLTCNPKGALYTSKYNKHIALVELRLMIESCLMKLFQGSNYAAPGTVLMVDGPLIHPFHIPAEASFTWSRDKVKSYSEALEYLNSERVSIVRDLLARKVLTIGIVKRLVKSYYLSSVDPAGLSVGRINDEAYVSTLLLRLNTAIEKPLIIGPIRVKHETLSASKLMWYIITPRRLCPLTSSMGNYVVYRVEVLENSSINEDEVLGHVFYDSIYTGSLLPLSLLVVDKRVKKITSSIVTYLLYMTGLTEESTSQYISVL